MSDEDQHRKRAEAFLVAASETDDMKRRGELIDEALYWHNLAMEAHDARDASHRDAREDWT